jgi:hypothetical protein
LKTWLLAAEFVSISAATVDTFATAVLPVIVDTFTIFGAVIYFFSYPKTIAIAYDLPVVAKLEDPKKTFPLNVVIPLTSTFPVKYEPVALAT